MENNTRNKIEEVLTSEVHFEEIDGYRTCYVNGEYFAYDMYMEKMESLINAELEAERARLRAAVENLPRHFWKARPEIKGLSQVVLLRDVLQLLTDEEGSHGTE